MKMRAKIGIAFAVAIGVVACALFASRSRPVVYFLTESGDPVHEPVWSILNPFRDRSPERPAEALLDDFKRGEYAQALSKIDDPRASKADIAQRETENRLQSWRMIDRRDSGLTTKLFYRTRRSGTSLPSPLWISVQRTDSQWKVTKFEAWY